MFGSGSGVLATIGEDTQVGVEVRVIVSFIVRVTFVFLLFFV